MFQWRLLFVGLRLPAAAPDSPLLAPLAAITHLQQQYDGSRRRYERLNKDFEDYKARAQRILHVRLMVGGTLVHAWKADQSRRCALFTVFFPRPLSSLPPPPTSPFQTKETALENMKRRLSGGASAESVDGAAEASPGEGDANDPQAWATQRERYEDLLAEARAEVRELQDRLDELEEQSQIEAEQVAAQIRELELAQQQERERRLEAEQDYKNHVEVGLLQRAGAPCRRRHHHHQWPHPMAFCPPPTPFFFLFSFSPPP